MSSPMDAVELVKLIVFAVAISVSATTMALSNAMDAKTATMANTTTGWMIMTQTIMTRTGEEKSATHIAAIKIRIDELRAGAIRNRANFKSKNPTFEDGVIAACNAIESVMAVKREEAKVGVL